LFSRSEKVHFNYQLSREITWLMWNFRKENSWAVEWLRTIVYHYSRNEESFRELCGYFNNSPAVEFLRNQAMTGSREEWEWLPAVPKDRLMVRINAETLTAFLPTGECFSVQKIPVEGGYFRVREDGRADIFLSRGSSKTGPVGWLWVLVNPSVKYSFDSIEAGIDPLDNYGALSGVNGFHTPLFHRISRAHAKARGWDISAAMYSDAVEMGIKGPPEPVYVPKGPFADIEQYFLDAERKDKEEQEEGE
jgi:hypothetical protein